MSMFGRKGTMVRKSRNRSSRRGQRGPPTPSVQENLGMAFGLDERTILQPSPCHSSTSSILVRFHKNVNYSLLNIDEETLIYL